MKAVNPSLKAWAVRLKRCLLGMKPKAGEELVTCGLVTLRICHIPFLSHVEICHIHKLVTTRIQPGSLRTSEPKTRLQPVTSSLNPVPARTKPVRSSLKALTPRLRLIRQRLKLASLVPEPSSYRIKHCIPSPVLSIHSTCLF